MGHRNFERRLRALEKQLGSDPICVHLSDGSTRELSRSKSYPIELLRAVLNPSNLSPAQLADLAMLTDAGKIHNPGNAGLLELACALYNSPD